MLESVEVECPYCGERVEIELDPQNRGQMVRDCEVCCNPWLLTVRWAADGTPEVAVEAAQ